MAHASIRFGRATRRSASGPGARYWTISLTVECDAHGFSAVQAAVFQPGGPGDFLGAIPLVPASAPKWLRRDTLSEHLFLYFFNEVQPAVSGADDSVLDVLREATVEFDVLKDEWIPRSEPALEREHVVVARSRRAPRSTHH
jgi:hypothetical protein